MAGLAIVTGAGGGIGTAISSRLAKDGYEVAAVDLNADGLNATVKTVSDAGGKISGHSVDLRDENALKQLVADLSPAQVLVNNAGVFKVRPFFETTAENFRFTYEVNVVAMFTLSRLVAERMPDGARIVNLSSRAALGGKNYIDYVASKSGVVGLTRAMAVELADRFITVNAVAPGAIETAMIATRPDIDSFGLVALQPIKRIGQPEDIANAVAFLASPQASYITGQNLLVDGGRSIGAFGVY